MKGLILSLLASAAMSPGHAPSHLQSHLQSQAVASSKRVAAPLSPVVSDWTLSGQMDQVCELQVEGEVTDASGADLSVECATHAQVMANVSAHVSTPASTWGWRQRRVTISAEIKASDATNASLWLKTQHDATTLMFDDDTEQNLLSTMQTADGWERRVITLPVAADATQVSFGVLLQGDGNVAVRQVELTVSEPGAIAPEATQLLDAAINIVKQQTSQRSDLAWQVLEPQLRLFASGAQSTAEVYPAIKYLLSRLGDKQSLLLTPDVAAALSRGAAVAAAGATESRVNVFALPDGARLVLSRTAAEPAVRTAQNLARPVALP